MFGFRLPIPRVNVVKRGMFVPSLPRSRRRGGRSTAAARRASQARRTAQERRAETARLLAASVAEMGRR